MARESVTKVSADFLVELREETFPGQRFFKALTEENI